MSAVIGLLALTALAFVAAFLGIGYMLLSPRGAQILDIPNARSSHSRPVPSGGGIWIAVVTLIGLLLLFLTAVLPRTASLAAFVAGAALVGFVSLLDDIYDLSYRKRILAQIAAAVLIVLSGLSLNTWSTPVLGTIELGWLGVPLALMFIVGLTNAYNFMDGIDGLAGLQAFLAGIFLAGLAWLVQDRTAESAALLIAGSALGFLSYNWSPARIFMGDVGSTFLGFSFAVLIVLLNSGDSRFFVMGMLVLWPFIFDSGFTLLRRAARGENIVEAHRSHLYQRFVDHGYNHETVTVFYGLLSVVGMILGLAWYYGYLELGVPLVIAFLAATLVLLSRRMAPTAARQ